MCRARGSFFLGAEIVYMSSSPFLLVHLAPFSIVLFPVRRGDASRLLLLLFPLPPSEAVARFVRLYKLFGGTYEEFLIPPRRPDDGENAPRARAEQITNVVERHTGCDEAMNCH